MIDIPTNKKGLKKVYHITAWQIVWGHKQKEGRPTTKMLDKIINGEPEEPKILTSCTMDGYEKPHEE